MLFILIFYHFCNLWNLILRHQCFYRFALNICFYFNCVFCLPRLQTKSLLTCKYFPSAGRNDSEATPPGGPPAPPRSERLIVSVLNNAPSCVQRSAPGQAPPPARRRPLSLSGAWRRGRGQNNSSPAGGFGQEMITATLAEGLF